MLCSTENSTQYSVTVYMEKDSKKTQVNICITDSLHCALETNLTP